MHNQNKLNTIHQLPKFESLSPYWKNYFNEIDDAIQENFWGNLATLKDAERCHDIYIQQQKEIGYCFKPGLEAPAPFYQSMIWVFDKLHRFVDEGVLSASDVLWPACVFEVQDANGNINYFFVVIGEEQPKNSVEVNLVTPDVFVSMLAQGYFPLGGRIREHTNQTLAEHDLAHYGGFISSPAYMRAIREGFRRVSRKMKKKPGINAALQNFNSVYSLRLYYMMEVFTIIPESKIAKLHDLLEINLNESVNINAIITLLEDKATKPVRLYQYLYQIYEHFYELVNPIGGESRDILNRVRKFNRTTRLGNFLSSRSSLSSKFDGSSIYSLYLNACAALENIRSTHSDFLASLHEIHAPLIGALIGTSQLTVEDWVLQAVEELPDPKSKLYQYLCESGIWNESHLIYWAYGCKDYARILAKNTSNLSM